VCGKGIFVALCRIWSVLLFALLDGGGGGGRRFSGTMLDPLVECMSRSLAECFCRRHGVCPIFNVRGFVNQGFFRGQYGAI